MKLFSRIALFTFLSMLFCHPAVCGQQAGFVMKPGDRIAIIGNTLPDRMQHDGWLESYFYAHLPKHDLVFRNLGFSGDELTLRLRSKNFGTPDQWMGKLKTDVVFAFFGYNESFAGPDGLSKFKSDLESFIKHTQSQRYNGKSAPRIVLFSPITHEHLPNPNLPNGVENNERLELYTSAMAEVAKQNNVPFVDLFHATKKIYKDSRVPLTINGVHLNSQGNHEIAKVIVRSLLPALAAKRIDPKHLEKIRQAVLDKNFYWFNRYRTTDGYSIYGGRAGLKFVGGQTNFIVAQREMEILDVMTANRDKRVWAVAQGRDLKVDDRNTPDFIPVISNRKGPLPGGKFLFLSGEEAIKKMEVPKGMKVTLFASEKEFPALTNPVQMAFDAKGRLWVAAWRTYPHWKPKEPMDDRLLIFEDTNGDGKADKMKVFAGDLHNPTGFEFWNGGVLIAHAPDVLFLKDTDGDDKADVRVRMLSGIGSADTHHTANSFTFDPGGALYFQEGTFHRTQVETPWNRAERRKDAGVYRYEPRSHKFDTYVAFRFANPHGHVFNKWGQDIVIDGTGAVPYHGTLFSGQVDYPRDHPQPPVVYNRKTRPCSGLEILSSRHFPKEYQDNLLVPNVIGFLGILRYKIVDDGASIKGIEMEPLLQSRDPNFRPADLEIGPDGAVYFTDWQNPIIGHMQHNLRDPNRDQIHGRIYKITYPSRPLVEPAKIDGAPIADLLNLLKEPEDRTRYRARIELGERNTDAVIAELKKWVAALDASHAGYEHNMMESLWLHQNHNVINEALLKRMLRSPNFRARAAATRVLCYWRDRVTDPLALLRVQINDSNPRVRLEAIRTLSFFHTDEALAVALEMLAHPTDRYLDYTFNETLRTLEGRLGSKLDRRNIAASLLKVLKQGNVDAQRRAVLLQTIIQHGGSAELTYIWENVQKPKGYSPALRRQVLEWLAETARIRRVLPTTKPDATLRLIRDASKNPPLLEAAVELAAAWKVREAVPDLQRIATNANVKPAARYAAIDGLAMLGGPESRATLTKLAKDAPMPVRFRAIVALAGVEIGNAAILAGAALGEAKKSDDPSYLVQGFLVHKNGSALLANAIGSNKISADTAKQILRAMYLAGRNDADLSQVASKIAGLDVTPRPPTAKEIENLTKLVQAKGDAARGEHIFRRADLGCVKCHAVHKAGGAIGPDLGPVGQASPVDYIVRSILDPSQSIKEEYITKIIATNSGKFFTGIEIERNNNQVKLKDATGKIIQVAVSDILQEGKGKSLMPEGVTRILTEGELVDLMRFVSELGKPGPFSGESPPTIRRWKRLSKVPPELQNAVPNREQIRELISGTNADQWETAFSLVNGKIPLNELKTDANVVYLQGMVRVRQAGPITVTLESTAPAMFWIDAEPYGAKKSATVDLSPGMHRITVRVEVGSAKAPELRVQLQKPAGSGSRFNIVHGE